MGRRAGRRGLRTLRPRRDSRVTSLLGGLRPEPAGPANRLPRFNVSAVAGHLVATAERARVIGEGGAPFSVAHIITGISDTGWANAYADATRRMLPMWDDDAKLTATVQEPCSGAGGIRTPGPLQVGRFQGGCIRPLCHRSARQRRGTLRRRRPGCAGPRASRSPVATPLQHPCVRPGRALLPPGRSPST